MNYDTLRYASLDDIPTLMEMSKELFTDSSYSLVGLDEAKVKTALEKFIVEDNSEFICLVSFDGDTPVGVLAAYAFAPMFSSDKIAVECLWYLLPSHRKSRRGKEMMEAYEYWARLVGCKVAQYGLLNSSPAGMERLYEKAGAKLAERVYTKEL